ncbi:MAG: histidine--tRNA ligase [Solirubrobacteraceae bacterium]
MSGTKLSAPRGTFDVLGDESRRRAQIERLASELLGGAGYERIETPTFEATELFARGVGQSTDIVGKEMYTLTDGSGRSLTLRPEGTAPVCRAYVEHGMHRRPQPVKLWYLASFYRYERAQKGRYRQFTQVGAEALGSEDPALDAESIVLLRQLLLAVGCKDLRLRLASLGSASSRASYRRLLQEHLRANEERLSDEVASRIELNPLRAFDSQHPGTLEVMKDAPLLMNHLQDADRQHFERVRTLLDAADVAYEVDPTLVRGLDYYERTVFELTSDALGAQSGVGGGGRYDGLVQELGGPATPGIGWAAGIERMLLASEQPAPPVPRLDLYICVERADGGGEDGEGADGGTASSSAAFELLIAARAAGVKAELELAGRSLKGQLGQAEKRRARFAAILRESGSFLRDLRSGQEQELTHQQLLARVAEQTERPARRD